MTPAGVTTGGASLTVLGAQIPGPNQLAVGTPNPRDVSGVLYASAGCGRCRLVHLDGATPVGRSSALEATSEVLPTRAAVVDTGDLVQLNAKAASVQGLEQTSVAESPLGAWAQLWSWQVVGAGFPWDRAHRAQFNRRPHVGLGQAAAAQQRLQQGAVVALQRQRFDKAAATLLQPKLSWVQRNL